MAFESYISSKSAFIFGLDNVLNPEKDYLLQVYYLFSEFMEYTEQMNSKEIIEFMQYEFANEGKVNIFEKTAERFMIDQKYKANFILLHENARLPLKLFLYQHVLSFLQEIVIERKHIYILAPGSPVQQLNKIKQIEWHGLEQYLRVYFSEEIESQPTKKSLSHIINQNNLEREEIFNIGFTEQEQESAVNAGVDFLSVTNLL